MTSTNGTAVNDARIATADIAANNGMLHIIEDVIRERADHHG
ncbi:MAG: fasciclin domain-containing protein [Candidatus Binatia bacterium]